MIGRAQVLNLSLGGEKDPAEIDVLRDVIAAGVVVVAAMGNEYDEGNPIEYPAAIPEVCAVGATDELDKRAGFSNTGRHIDLVAPGVVILSTTPTFRYDGDGEQDYDAWDGTSMATPHVAGAAALVLAKSPRLHAGAGHQEADLVGRPRRRREERQRGIRGGPSQLREGAALSGGRMKSEGRGPDAVKLIVKVDPKRSKDPARHVSKCCAAPVEGRVEEVFPGLRDGSSAGLVTVTLPDEPDRRCGVRR